MKKPYAYLDCVKRKISLPHVRYMGLKERKKETNKQGVKETKKGRKKERKKERNRE